MEQRAVFRHFAEPAQDRVLDTAPEDPAADEKSVDGEHVARRLGNGDPHEAIVTEAIAHIHAQHRAPAARERAHFRLGASHRGEVELVGALGELRDPRPFVLSRGGDIDDEPERGDEFGNVGCRVLQLVPRGVLAVHVRATRVLVCDRQLIESPQVREERLVVRRNL